MNIYYSAYTATVSETHKRFPYNDDDDGARSVTGTGSRRRRHRRHGSSKLPPFKLQHRTVARQYNEAAHHSRRCRERRTTAAAAAAAVAVSLQPTGATERCDNAHRDVGHIDAGRRCRRARCARLPDIRVCVPRRFAVLAIG